MRIFNSLVKKKIIKKICTCGRLQASNAVTEMPRLILTCVVIILMTFLHSLSSSKKSHILRMHDVLCFMT